MPMFTVELDEVALWTNPKMESGHYPRQTGSGANFASGIVW